MQIKNIKSWSKFSRKRQYALSTLVLFAIFFLQHDLFPVLGDYYHYAFFRFASVVVALYFGFGPSMYVLGVGTLLGAYFFVPPRGQFAMPTEKDLFDWIVLFGTSVVISVLVEMVQRQRYKNELLLRISNSRYESLLHRENHRLILSKKLDAKNS